MNTKKIMSLDDLPGAQAHWKEKRSVLVGGCFDLLHYGHYTFLKHAKEAGDVLIIALESDEFIIQRKKRQPVHTQRQRAEILATLELVDFVIELPLLSSGAQYGELVASVRPTIIAVTEGDPHLKKKQEHARKYGTEVREVTSHVSNFSTSGIISYATLFSD